MKRSGGSAPSLAQYSDLKSMMFRDGPFVTVWTSRPDLTPKALASQASAVRDAVDRARTGMDESVADDVVETLSESIAAALPTAAGVVGVADPSGVLLCEPLDDPPPRASSSASTRCPRCRR